ncbi:phosphatase PAP2 family protein, partial [Methylibium sp.]|uniref:phosphatase PAP2 family protein n=1 Tax=Methylibium sp. TaxID=2067992 RepID=UPI00345C34DA
AMTQRARARRQDAFVALLALGALLCWDFSGLDLVVTGWFGDAGGFAWRDAWLTSALLHRGGRNLAGAVLALMTIDALRPLVAGPPRAERMRWLGTTLVCLLLVPALKRASLTSCPWDLQGFGGVAAYVPHWRVAVADGGPGHCFPSGHAVAAFAFLSGYFLWRRHRPVAARRWLVGVCLAGLTLGGAQVARGAHFPSHVLWSAWLCWCVCALSAKGRWRPRPAVETCAALASAPSAELQVRQG